VAAVPSGPNWTPLPLYQLKKERNKTYAPDAMLIDKHYIIGANICAIFDEDISSSMNQQIL
jgi:hypothetical protein